MKLRVLWVRTTPVIDEIHNSENMAFHRHAKDVDAYNKAADEIMGQAGVPTIDLHHFSSCFGAAGFCDHVHYHDDVRERQGAYIAGAIELYLNEKLI